MKFSNPIRIIGGWILIVIIVDIIVIPILLSKSVGGEQAPITFFMNSLSIAMYGIFILSIVTTIVYFKRPKDISIFNLILFIVSGLYIIQEFKSNSTHYTYNEEIKFNNGFEIKIRKEYYSLDPDKIRSINYWKNDKKDSIWTVYAEDGHIIKKEVYKNDTLIRRMR